MKKLYKLLFPGIAVAALLTGTQVANAAPVNEGVLYYELDETAKTATVVNHSSYAELTSVSIPGSLKIGEVVYTVKSVANSAFQGCKALTSVTVGEGVEEIGKWSFTQCAALTSVILPSTLTKVGQSGFSNCNALKSLDLPDNITVIESFGFGNCTGLESVSLPKNIVTIGNQAFANDSKLKNVVFKEGVETITDNAFYGCAIVELSLPASVKDLGRGAFSNNKALTTIKFPNGIKSIGEQSFYKCEALKEIVMPNSLESIGMAAFYECKAVTKITFSTGIKSIESNAFYGCASLPSVTWPSILTEMSSGMFYNCSSLTSITLPETLKTIGKASFQGCSSLKSIALPSGLTEISQNLFNRCSALESITIPANVKTIGASAFYYCSKLTEITIPSGIESIEGVVFLGCTSLTKINVDAANKNYADINGVLTNKDKTQLIVYPGGLKGEYTLPESITEIGGYSFNSNQNITGLKCNSGLKSIGTSAFAMSRAITHVDIPQSVTSIGDMAFFYCSKISSITIPNDIQYVGMNSLSATAISSLIFPEGIESLGFSATGSTFSVFGSCGSLKWMSLPSTLKKISPLGLSCNNMNTIYSFAVTPPEASGENQMTVASQVKVPKGSAEAYAAAWKTLFPNVTFDAVLPGAPTVDVNAGKATLNWETYSDDTYTGTPVRYTITLIDGNNTKETVLDGDKATGKNLSYTFEGLKAQTYGYKIEGYSANGTRTMRNSGEFNILTSGIDEIEGSEIVSTEYFDLMGRKVTNPQPNTIYVVRSLRNDGTVITGKTILK